MELPFLKNKKQDGGGGSTIVKHASTKDDGMGDDDLMDQVAAEFLSAIERKDHKGLREALSALVHYIQDEDEEQDQEMTS